ncbi:MAG: NAD(P)/FAD-dependent oxidoreductase [Anaerolineae bacterium]|jgi:protoporphyrinogen oxidase|nr:NAD(P)/FAD-dependent oxidoreductase [Anaerolineae bacterium]
MTPDQKSIAIIGAGVAGMAAAWDLCRAGHAVTLYEAGDRVGGLAAGFQDEGWSWSLEKFYHHWFEGDQDILRLIAEMGHAERVIFPRPKTSYWIDGHLYRSEISPSALFLPLSPLAKLRFALTGAYIKLTPFWQSLEQFTADAWLRFYMGEEAYGKFFRPLLIGKFGAEYDRVNMAWLWARVKARSLRLGGFVGGFQACLEAMAAAIQAQGAVIHLNAPAQKIALSQPDLRPTLTVGGSTVVYDAILSTTSPAIMLKLTEGLAGTHYGDQMAALKSIGGLCVVLALRQQLLTDGTYWLNLPATTPDKARSEFPFLALVEHTNYMDKAHYGGDHIVYCGDYAPPDHEYFTLPADALVARFLPALKKVNPAFDETWLRKSWVWRAPYAQPVPYVHHSTAIPPLATPLPGVLWASMSQVYPWDRGTNFAVEIGRRAAGLILAGKA